jgi:hypothetical protein
MRLSQAALLLVSVANVGLSTSDVNSDLPEEIAAMPVRMAAQAGHLQFANTAGDEGLVEQLSRTEMKLSSMSYSEYMAAALPDRRSNRISQDVAYNGLYEQILTFPMRKPFSFNLIVATIKTFSADLTVQFVETRTRLRTGAPGRTTIDPMRSAAFLTFGFVYIGCVQWCLIVSLMVILAPHAVQFSNEAWAAKLHDIPGEEDLLKQVMIDNLAIAPFLYFPAFYILKELVATRFNKASAPLDALRKWRGNLFQDNFLSMLFWIPGDALAFAAPIYMRLPLDHLISFAWTMVLSFLRGGSDVSHPKKDKEDPTLYNTMKA